MTDTQEQTPRRLIPTPRTPLQRFGCGILLIIWFAILLLPCGMFWLATGNDITLSHSDVPDAYEHPLLRINLIMDTDNRGLQITTSSIHARSNEQLCVQTNVNYLLWASEDDNNNTVYCQCYERPATASTWQFTEQTATTCTNE